jgi:hypothetical protein
MNNFERISGLLEAFGATMAREAFRAVLVGLRPSEGLTACLGGSICLPSREDRLLAFCPEYSRVVNRRSGIKRLPDTRRRVGSGSNSYPSGTPGSQSPLFLGTVPRLASSSCSRRKQFQPEMRAEFLNRVEADVGPRAVQEPLEGAPVDSGILGDPVAATLKPGRWCPWMSVSVSLPRLTCRGHIEAGSGATLSMPRRASALRGRRIRQGLPSLT